MDAVKIGATFGFWGPAHDSTVAGPAVETARDRRALRPVGTASPAPPSVCDSAARAQLELALSHGRLIRSVAPVRPPHATTPILLPGRDGAAHNLPEGPQDEPPAYHTLARRAPEEEWEELTAEIEDEAHLVTPSTSRYSTYRHRSSSASRRPSPKKSRAARGVVQLPMPRWPTEDDDSDDEEDERGADAEYEREERTNRRLDSLSRRMQRLIVQGQRALASRIDGTDEVWSVGDVSLGSVGVYDSVLRNQGHMGRKRMVRPAVSHSALKGSVRGRPRVPVRAKSSLAIGFDR